VSTFEGRQMIETRRIDGKGLALLSFRRSFVEREMLDYSWMGII
jgi:hypothetical protein